MTISIFDQWADSILEIIKEESSLVSDLTTHSVELGSSRESIIEGILKRILPDIYEIGTGVITDHLGKSSRQIDIIIARRDIPSFKLPSGSKVYLIESVLATIEIKSTLTSDELEKALENCASVADLNPNVIAGVLGPLAKKRGLERKGNDYTHLSKPLETGRFDLLGRPVSYIFGFNGYKNNIKSFAEAIAKWCKPREKGNNLAMRHFPAVICTEGCLAWRNDAPYSTEDNYLLLLSKEVNPLRHFILHILYTLNRKVPPYKDMFGIAPNLDAYLQQIQPPNKPELTVGSAFNKLK